MTTHSISQCQTFLEVDDMKFMAFDSQTNGALCDCCYFNAQLDNHPHCALVDKVGRTYCMARQDKRQIIWMRIL